MRLTYKNLVKMLGDGYDAGTKNCPELRDQIIDEVVAEVTGNKIRDLRVYLVDELKKFPVGSKFVHSVLGVGHIVVKKGVRLPVMEFDVGVNHAFSIDQFPWNLPMACLSEGKKSPKPVALPYPKR